MAETEMVEHVARALYDERLRRAPAAAAQFDLPWDALPDDERRPWLFLARAAIEAMRKASRDVLTAFVDDAVSLLDAEIRWNAAIDAALSPPSKD